MCGLCNGTHILRTSGTYTALVRVCPTCGPKSVERLAAERKVRLQRLEAAKIKLGMVF